MVNVKLLSYQNIELSLVRQVLSVKLELWDRTENDQCEINTTKIEYVCNFNGFKLNGARLRSWIL